jgi:hypothetical protein
MSTKEEDLQSQSCALANSTSAFTEPISPVSPVSDSLSLNCSRVNDSEFVSAPPFHVENGSRANDSKFVSAPPLHVEYGIGYTYSDLREAKREAKRQRKPIFCTRTGADFNKVFHSSALTHPLIVEAVESLFVTVNSEIDLEVPGSPVCATVQILDEKGTPLLPHIGGDLLLRRNMVVVVELLVKSLTKCSIEVPKYLQLLLEEESGRSEVLPSGKRRKLDRIAIFGVSDYHVIEAKFANAAGVLNIQAGLYKGRQVLQVTYASRVTSFDSLLRYALSSNFATSIYYQSQDEFVVARSVCDQLRRSYHIIGKIEDSSLINNVVDGRSGIRKTALRYVPMTSLQKVHANKLVHEGLFNEASHLLSPRQAEKMMRSFSNVNARRDFVDLPLIEAWNE